MTRYCIASLIAFLVFALPGTSLQNVLAANDPIISDLNYDYREFAHWLKQTSDEKQIPGAAFAIVSREGIMYLQTWGLRSVSNQDRITNDSVFRIASMSKTFAGAAASLLIEKKLQSWDRKITDIFPSLRLGNKTVSRDITLRHLVSHSTGLMPHSYSNLLDDGVVYEKIRDKFHQIPTVCSPGDCYGYQNVIFSLIADVVEDSANVSYEDFLNKEIFKPLGMSSASVGMDAFVNDPNAVEPHRMVRGDWRTTTTNPAYYSVAPASGVNASIFDMAMWVRANLGAFPEVMSPVFLSNLHAPIIDTPHGNYFNRWSGIERAYYATGWRVFDYRGLRVVHHGGGVRGFRSEMVFVPDGNIGMVLLFNAESNLANEVVPTFLDNLTKTQ